MLQYPLRYWDNKFLLFEQLPSCYSCSRQRFLADVVPSFLLLSLSWSTAPTSLPRQTTQPCRYSPLSSSVFALIPMLFGGETDPTRYPGSYMLLFLHFGGTTPSTSVSRQLYALISALRRHNCIDLGLSASVTRYATWVSSFHRKLQKTYVRSTPCSATHGLHNE